ncbi:MAG: hypothetical protein GF401_06105 [Chitinivibrionales bacterium]|nr:hypothetical protein [Chitinivibrionales bacterium]
MLALSPTMESGKIAQWSKKEGDPIESGDVLCQVETDKTTMDYESTSEGALLKIIAPEGSEVNVGDNIAIIGEKGEDISELPSETVQPESEKKEIAEPEQATHQKNPQEKSILTAQPAESEGNFPRGVPVSPLARKMAADKGIDLHSVKGSGPRGRIVKKDVEGYSPPQPNLHAPPRGAALRDEIIPVSEKRRVIAQRLSNSFYSAPHYSLSVEVVLETLLSARTRINKSSGEKISLNAFIVKFTAQTLVNHPMVNSSWEYETIHRYGTVDIALAVAQPDGLITPVVHDCETKGIRQIDHDLKELIGKARENRLAPEEYSGGTFTISNLGSMGIREFTAIINPPQAAILAVGEIVKKPLVDENNDLAVHNTMMLTLSCDHRILDGAVSAAFLSDLKKFLEYPIEALL